MTRKVFICSLIQIAFIVGLLLYLCGDLKGQRDTLAVKNKLLRLAVHNLQEQNSAFAAENISLRQSDFHSIMMVLLRESVRQKIPVNVALALAGIESNFDPGAISVTGDFGLYQVNEKSWPFDRREILKPGYNIALGLWILRHYYDKAGDWSLACAMYNRGSSHELSDHPRKLSESRFYK